MLVYGLTIDALDDRYEAGPTRHPWHPVDLRRVQAAEEDATEVLWSPEQAVLTVAGGVGLTVDRDGLVVTVGSPDPISDDEVEHPLLAFVGSVVARWAGRTALHGAAVTVRGSAWVVLGSPGGGKSTIAAAAARRGLVVLSDDLVVITDDLTVLSGPRVCDLREGASLQIIGGRPVQRHQETRWRTDLGPAPLETPLGGIVDLRVGTRISCTPVPLGERLMVLAAAEALGLGPSRPTSFLRMLGVPMLALTRTASWDDLDALIDVIEDVDSR